MLSFLVSSAVVAFALRARSMGWMWMIIGICGVSITLLAAHEIPRRVNGYVLSAVIPLITVPFFSYEMTRSARSGLVFATLLATGHSGWMEFLGPALARMELATLHTRMTPNGFCIQSTDYTCGPAAAVTALSCLGFKAEEGDIALRANCSEQTGTDPSDLAAAIDDRFGIYGVRVEYRAMETRAELQRAGLSLTVVRYSADVDHWVTVLKIDETSVYYADPARGMRVEPRAEFAEKWEHETVRIWRDAGAVSSRELIIKPNSARERIHAQPLVNG
jgi:predicted double-glycine peptidase